MRLPQHVLALADDPEAHVDLFGVSDATMTEKELRASLRWAAREIKKSHERNREAVMRSIERMQK